MSRRYWLHDVLKHLDWATGLVHPLRIKFWQCLFDDDFEKNGKEAMKRHYDEVRSCAKIQGRRVLEMRLGDGWGPLCEFLEVEIPREAYPRENTSDGFIPKMKERARLRLLAVGRKWMKLLLIVVMLGGPVVLAASYHTQIDLP